MLRLVVQVEVVGRGLRSEGVLRLGVQVRQGAKGMLLVLLAISPRLALGCTETGG